VNSSAVKLTRTVRIQQHQVGRPAPPKIRGLVFGLARRTCRGCLSLPGLPDVPRVADEGPPNLEAGRAARCVRAAAPRRDKGEEGRGQERKAAAKAESKRAKVEKKVRERRCKAGV
jgi:hypothetical protein